MPRRWATRLGGAALAAVLAAVLPQPAPAQTAPQVIDGDSLTPADLRELALRAVQAGDVALALALAQRVLAADPDDRGALMVVALAAPSQGRTAEALRAGGRAFALSRSDAERYEAARLAARVAYGAGAYTRSQLWLRRALLYADTPAERRLTAYDYRTVRAKNPLRFDLQLSLSQSDNVNGGASGSLLDIDGVPVVGYLSPSAQALSGRVAWSRLTIGYTLSESPAQRTRLGASLYWREVWLSAEARRRASDVSNGDFRARVVEASLGQERLLAPGLQVSFETTLGQQDYGGEIATRYAGLEMGLERRTGETAATGLKAGIEFRRLGAGGSAFETGRSLTLSHRGALAGGRLTLSLAVEDTASDRPNDRHYGAEAMATFRPGRPVGPVSVAFSLGAAYTRYPDYTLLIFDVPGGRVDRSLFGSVEFTPQGFGIAGFVPVLGLVASRTESNVGRFDREQMSLQFGFRSAF